MLVYLRDGSAQTIFTCCHTEVEVADQTFYLTQSQYTDTGPTSPSTDPIMPGAGVPIFKSLVWLDPEKSRRKRDLNSGPSAPKADALTTRPPRRSGKGGWNSSVSSMLGSLSCMMQCHGLILLWASGRGDLSFGVNMGSDSIPPKLFRWEYEPRSSLCAHMHSIAWTQKILTFMSHTGEWWQQKYTQYAPSTKTEFDYLYGWIKIFKLSVSHMQKSHQNWWAPQLKLGVLKKKKTLGKADWQLQLSLNKTWQKSTDMTVYSMCCFTDMRRFNTAADSQHVKERRKGREEKRRGWNLWCGWGMRRRWWWW